MNRFPFVVTCTGARAMPGRAVGLAVAVSAGAVTEGCNGAGVAVGSTAPAIVDNGGNAAPGAGAHPITDPARRTPTEKRRSRDRPLLIPQRFYRFQVRRPVCRVDAKEQTHRR